MPDSGCDMRFAVLLPSSIFLFRSKRLGVWHQLRSGIRDAHWPSGGSAPDDRTGQRGLLFSTPFVLRRASGNYRAGLEVLIGDDQKSGSDLGLVSRVKELLRGSRTGCQYRWNPISCTSLLPCHGTAKWNGVPLPKKFAKRLSRMPKPQRFRHRRRPSAQY